MSEMKEKNYDLEWVYDEKIAPLMAQIIEVCKEHKLPMFATFQYRSDIEGVDDGEDRFCTTNRLFDAERPVNEGVLQLLPTLMRRRRSMVAMTITTTAKENL